MTNTFILLIITLAIPLILGMYMLNMNSFILTKIKISNIFTSELSIDIMLDWTSLLFLSTVIIISSMIILFSKYYIPNNEQNQFLILLLMFVLSMMLLILSNNLFLILLGWDGLGLSSYILVIYYQNFSSASSGTITLLSNRIGDILILLSLALLFSSFSWSFMLNNYYSMIILILLMMAACSKSAQFPFSAWLPMAMAAPTPISALVHSSTLVTAGVFLILRMNYYPHPTMMMILLLISSSTALYASMSANWEQDLKKIIALSTLSQIAMMMFAISMSMNNLAYLHLIIHAMFKSTMFLCAGIMIHESSYQDSRMMGLNYSNFPLITSILGINSMALMGTPFMSGFFSKDIIIENLISFNQSILLMMMMIMSIGMTASYTIRMTFMSSKSLIKNSPFLSNHQSNNAILPIMFLSVFGITSGSWMMWLLYPDMMIMIDPFYKILIISMLIMGLLMGFKLQFKSKKYLNLGLSSITLWYTHYMSIIPTKYLSPLMMFFHNNDKMWQENYGPQKLFINIKLSSFISENFKSLSLFTVMLMSILLSYLI